MTTRDTPRIRLICDSISTAGIRLTTVTGRLDPATAARLHAMARTVCTIPDTARDGADPGWLPPVLITSTDFEDLYNSSDLTALADAVAGVTLTHRPRRIDDHGMHAPLTTLAEADRLGLQIQGMLSTARCHQRPGNRDVYTDIAVYQQLIQQPNPGGGLWHPALPISHTAFIGRNVQTGRFPGWISWREMLTYRGEVV